MNFGLGCHSAARTGLKQSLLHSYQIWCPHVAQAPRPCAKQAQATSLAAPSCAPGVTRIELQGDAPAPPDEGNNGASPAASNVAFRSLNRNAPGLSNSYAGAASAATPGPSGPCLEHAASHLSQHHGSLASSSFLTHTRPPADRTAEASTSASSIVVKSCHSCSSRSGRRISVGRSASGGSDSSISSHPRHHRHRRSRLAAGSSGSSLTGVNSNSLPDVGSGKGAAAASSIGAAGQDSVAAAAAVDPPMTARDRRQNTGAAAVQAASRQPLTLERLREQTAELRPLDLSALQQRLAALCGLLQLDDTATLMLCRVVPGLLLVQPAAMQRTWRRLSISLGGEEPARSAAVTAPLLLVLPSDRVPAAVASLAAATAMSRVRAAAMVAEWPQLATHAPMSLEAKLETLRRLLVPEGPSTGGAGPTVLRAALCAAPRLLTFSTAALTRHYAELTALLGSRERLQAALRREPGLLLQRPAAVAAKLALLQQLMDCCAQPGAVAALVVRRPGLLRRSLAALAAGCRALSIWQFRRRDKLYMCLARPGLLTLPPAEVHGRCRWLRRLMLSNAYYHAALRRLPPSLVAAVVAALPVAWPRLQYLAESSQECRMALMDAVEVGEEEFTSRFPEFTRWLQFKTKLMGADNPWRDTRRIRGFNPAAREKPAHGSPNHVNLMQRRQRVQRRQQRQQQHDQSSCVPCVPMVLAEACEVRSGSSTVSRPRRVLRQPLADAIAAATTPPPVPLSVPPSSPLPASPPAAEDPSGPPSVLVLPPAGAAAPRRFPGAGDPEAEAGPGFQAPAAATVASAAGAPAAATELSR